MNKDEAAHNEDSRSVEQIADYLQKLPPVVWEQGTPGKEQRMRLAKIVKRCWKTSDPTESFNIALDFWIKEAELKDTVDGLAEFLKIRSAGFQNERELVGISHQVKETGLTHDFDVNQLKGRIDHIFQTFYEENDDDEEPKPFYAPYLCFVQSRGMGKTKIMYELCKHYNDEKNSREETCGRLVLCRKAETGDEGMKEREIFHHFISLHNDRHRNETFRAIKNDVFEKLDKLLTNKKLAERVVLFFDEAHYLLETGEYEGENMVEAKQMEALLFRIVRRWLCVKRNDRKIVAVFTGTTAKLTNFIIENDLTENISDTRHYRKDDYYKPGQNTYKPFYTTTTIGCLRFQEMNSSIEQNEYQVAVCFGRPLFASITPKQLSDGEKPILSRMLQDPKRWEGKNEAWLSVLGTRVQMGQTNLPLASSLVAGSYANIVSFTRKKKEETQQPDGKEHLGAIKICFPPDPVCARLAMCLMDSEWTMPSANLKGKDKQWWVGKVEELYSLNLCSPEKGDFGEVMVALYFLFCADTLRSKLSNDYTTFSVELGQWISCLVSGGSATDDEKPNAKKRKKAPTKIEFSAIQVCRNYIRAYDDSWSWLRNEVFLKNMYTAGVGFYVFAGCGLIDLAFALRVGKETEEGEAEWKYVPMFVSVKSHVYFGPRAAKMECERMKSRCEEENKESGGALCVLVVLGSLASSDDGEYQLSPSICEAVALGNVVSKVLRVPTDDDFGLSQAFLRLTTMQDEMSEVLASHSFLGAHGEAEINRTTTAEDCSQKVLRPGTSVQVENFAIDFAALALRTGRSAQRRRSSVQVEDVGNQTITLLEGLCEISVDAAQREKIEENE